MKRKLLSVFAVLAAAALLVLIFFWPDGAARWEETETRVTQLEKEAQFRTLPRSVLHGTPVPGKAWEEYNLALDDGIPWEDDQNGALLVHFANGQKVDLEKIQRILTDHAGALEHLSRGTQRTDGQYPYLWRRGIEMQLPGLLQSRRLANLGVARAKVLRESGRTQEAMDLLLDVATFGRDLATNGPLLSTLIGYSVSSTALEQLTHLIRSGKLTRNQLADLARQLEIMERDLPPLSLSLSNEVLSFGMLVLTIPGGEVRQLYSMQPPGTKRDFDWRLTLFPRAMMMEAFQVRDASVPRFRNLDDMNYAAARKEANAIHSEAQASSNTLVQDSTSHVPHTVYQHRDVLARMRLLRAAATFLATGEMPLVSDPFGDKLSHKRETNSTKIWSVGRDGIDQSGKGSWDGMPDIVLELAK